MPVLCKIRQHMALKSSRPFWRMQNSRLQDHVRNKGVNPVQDSQCQPGGITGRMRIACGHMRGPGQIHRQMGVPAQGQMGKGVWQIGGAIVQTALRFKKAQAYLVHLAR